MMKMPALAVVGPDHRIVRSTETFRRRYEGAEKMCESSPELRQVLAGQADIATVNLGELTVAIEAVTDAIGRRQAMLTLPPLDPAPVPESPLDALRDTANESPAIVWVKDLDGHYLYANPRYEAELGTSEVEDGREEPLQLEYTVPATDRSPALAVFRFALRDDRGQPIGTCGVAAPADDAQTAHEEAVQLMQLERWNRLDPAEVRTELLEQWRLETISRPPEAPAAPVPAPPPIPASAAPLDSDRAKLLQTDLQMARKWADRAEELQGELEEAREAAARAAEEAERWRSEAEQARRELIAARVKAETVRSPSVSALSLSEELGRAGSDSARGGQTPSIAVGDQGAR